MNVTLIVLQMYETYFLVDDSILYTISYDFKFAKICTIIKAKHLS